MRWSFCLVLVSGQRSTPKGSKHRSYSGILLLSSTKRRPFLQAKPYRDHPTIASCARYGLLIEDTEADKGAECRDTC